MLQHLSGAAGKARDLFANWAAPVKVTLKLLIFPKQIAWLGFQGFVQTVQFGAVDTARIQR